MIAKYAGRDAETGARINPGDEIKFCTVTRKAWHHEPGDCRVATVPRTLVVAKYAGRKQYFLRG